jgi:hypothetical protein
MVPENTSHNIKRMGGYDWRGAGTFKCPYKNRDIHLPIKTVSSARRFFIPPHAVINIRLLANALTFA